MTVLDELATLQRASVLICGFSLEISMNQATLDELVVRCCRTLPYGGARALWGIHLVIDNGLSWNVSEWVKRKDAFTVISRERVPVFPPEPILFMP